VSATVPGFPSLVFYIAGTLVRLRLFERLFFGFFDVVVDFDFFVEDVLLLAVCKRTVEDFLGEGLAELLPKRLSMD
jgi:hypothetical protein